MTIAANRPLKSARSRAWGSRALGWWLSELAACTHDLRRVIATNRGQGITIEAGERYWLLRRGAVPLGQIEAHADEAERLRRLIPTTGRRRAVIVEIPPERALAKTIALPAGASGQIDRILGFEIARHFPFPAERVYFQHRQVKNPSSGAVMVEIVAVPRDIVDTICLVLGEAGLRPAAVAVSAGTNTPPLFLPASALTTAKQPLPARTRVLGVTAALAAVATLASWPIAQQVQLAAFDNELSALKPRAEAALRTVADDRRAGERTASILALGGGRPPLVTVLDALSRDLPDGAWLLSLSVAGRDIVLDGLAPSAASIALTLEKTHNVSGIVFRSPISREASGLEHFQLGATVGQPAGSVKP